MEGRDANGRFVAGWSPDRGRGRAPAPAPAPINLALHELVMDIANLPISIARGRARRVVTLFEAQVRRLASGRVYRRASVMDFIQLVQMAAAEAPAKRSAAEMPNEDLSPAILRLQEQVALLRKAGDEQDAERNDQAGVIVAQLILEIVSERKRKRRASSRKR